jgi:hypothetical protein
MSPSLSILIVEKSGTLKSLSVKDYDEAELYKKCGFKKADGFDKQNEWTVKINGTKYLVSMYAKTDGKAGSENKYDFPPPVDTKLFFGSCALVAMQKIDDGAKHVNLSVELWEQIYEKLFGGFEDLTSTAVEDENEEDELENVPTSKKTKNGGYLKDGFVVDDDEDDEGGHVVTDEDSDNLLSTENSDETDDRMEDIVDLNDAGSELSEESYDE